MNAATANRMMKTTTTTITVVVVAGAEFFDSVFALVAYAADATISAEEYPPSTISFCV